MAAYTLHLDAQARPGERAALERAVVLRDGFSWGALIFQPLWVLWHRLWLAALVVTIAIAVFEVGKFMVEEELIRERQLRSVLEARRSLTKFVKIVIITLSLEGLVLVFETKLEHVAELIYPTALLMVAVLAVVGLGVFQRLTSDSTGNEIGADRPGHGPSAGPSG